MLQGVSRDRELEEGGLARTWRGRPPDHDLYYHLDFAKWVTGSPWERGRWRCRPQSHRGQSEQQEQCKVAAMNTGESYPLASDHSWKDLTAVLEADEVRPIHRHPANQSHC